MNMLANITRPEGDPKIIAGGASAVPAADRLARALGWFSIGLGAVQLTAPRLLTRILGMRGSEGVMRLLGTRQIASGVLTLSTERQTGIASRIAGDVIDMAVLATALGADNRKRGNVGFALALVAGVTLIDLAAKKALADTHGRRGPPRSYADRSGFPKRRSSASLEMKKPEPSSDETRRPNVSAGPATSEPITADDVDIRPLPDAADSQAGTHLASATHTARHGKSETGSTGGPPATPAKPSQQSPQPSPQSVKPPVQSAEPPARQPAATSSGAGHEASEAAKTANPAKE